MFHSTDARRACRRGAIGSTMGAYPRDTGSNPVEGNGHFFPSYRQLYLSSFFDTHTHTHTHTHTLSLTHSHTCARTHAYTQKGNTKITLYVLSFHFFLFTNKEEPCDCLT